MNCENITQYAQMIKAKQEKAQLHENEKDTVLHLYLLYLLFHYGDYVKQDVNKICRYSVSS